MDKRYIISTFLNKHDFDTDILLNVIIDNNIEYTNNSNGIFINISLLSDSIVDKIYDTLSDIYPCNPVVDIKYKNKNYKKSYEEISNNKTIKENIKLTPIDKLLISLSKQTFVI
jgi:hypothetical protein